MSETKPSFTGRARRHRTRWSVRLSDFLARWIITIGGIGTIIAVLTVFAFLAWVVLPLFLPAAVSSREELRVPWSDRPLAWEGNEYSSLIWELSATGSLHVYRLSDGAAVDQRQLWTEPAVTAISQGETATMLGLADGTLRIGQINSLASLRERNELSEAMRQLPDDASGIAEGSLVELRGPGEFRIQTVSAEFADSLMVAKDAIVSVDHLDMTAPDSLSAEGPLIAAVARGGTLHLLATKKNEITGGLQIDQQATLQLDRPDAPIVLRLLGRGDNLIVAYEDGELSRFDLRMEGKIQKVETVALTTSGARVTSAKMMLGRETLLVGDTTGQVGAWFRVREGEGATSVRFTRVHELKTGRAAVTSIATSPRSRLAAFGFADGAVQLFHVTTENLAATIRGTADDPVVDVRFLPKEDGLLVLSKRHVRHYDLQPRHPDGTMSAFFRPIWYEGYERPMHVWQSSFAGVEPEIKLGLWPLVFGTLKATFYSMMFGTPLALLAAVYTSEFTRPAVKSKIKPIIETMASLPSVVLGFMAALVFAPILEAMIPGVLACFVMVPLTFVGAAALWQLIPNFLALRLERFRLLFLTATLAAGTSGGLYCGGMVETLLYAGDIRSWLDGQRGSGVGASMLILLPISFFTMAIVNGSRVNPWLARRAAHLGRLAFAVLNLIKVLLELASAFGAAYLLALLLDLCGLDLRGTIVDTYVQRNAMIVGFAVGFAIIPIIYTIAEDALSTVPQHLRSASLGAGATQWQTAVRVVIPTAMSGLFSAVMIGLGRAVGETMIILMAGGNTPEISLNPFSGLRTLSANIAVELPEAVRDSTHYRALFFAGFVLFIITFVVNTIAEIIRLRFRRRAYQL